MNEEEWPVAGLPRPMPAALPIARTEAMIFIDESGDPGLAAKATIATKPFFVFGFVYSRDSGELRKRLRRLLKKMRLRKKYPPHLSELKFYLPYSELNQLGYSYKRLDEEFTVHMPMIRTHALGLIEKHADGIFAAIVDKRKARPSWTSEEIGNFAFAETLFVNVLNGVVPPECPLVMYDKGRLSPANSSRFRAYIKSKESFFEFKGFKKYSGSLPEPIEGSSQAEPGLWAADLVAGAFYHKYSNRDASYANMLSRTRIGLGERLFWD